MSNYFDILRKYQNNYSIKIKVEGKVMVEHLTRILLVEDNAINADIVHSLLAEMGYCCDIANSGEKAINLFLSHQNHYKAVILDIGLPDISGFEVAEKIRKLDSKAPFNKKTPIIFSTAHIDEQARKRADELCAYGFLAKPISFEYLKNILNIIMS